MVCKRKKAGKIPAFVVTSERQNRASRVPLGPEQLQQDVIQVVDAPGGSVQEPPVPAEGLRRLQELVQALRQIGGVFLQVFRRDPAADGLLQVLDLFQQVV